MKTLTIPVLSSLFALVLNPSTTEAGVARAWIDYNQLLHVEFTVDFDHIRGHCKENGGRGTYSFASDPALGEAGAVGYYECEADFFDMDDVVKIIQRTYPNFYAGSIETDRTDTTQYTKFTDIHAFRFEAVTDLARYHSRTGMTIRVRCDNQFGKGECNEENIEKAILGVGAVDRGTHKKIFTLNRGVAQ